MNREWYTVGNKIFEMLLTVPIPTLMGLVHLDTKRVNRLLLLLSVSRIHERGPVFGRFGPDLGYRSRGLESDNNVVYMGLSVSVLGVRKQPRGLFSD